MRVKKVFSDNYIFLSKNGTLLEMANLHSDITDIENIVIYIGPPSGKHQHRVKISNIPNTFSISDNFVIGIPDLIVKAGKINKSFINKEILDKINQFLLNYSEYIIQYSEYEITKEQLYEKINEKRQKLNELNESFSTKISREEFDVLSSITGKKAGVPELVIWIGPNHNSNRVVVKIGNVPNDYKGKSCFNIILPDFKIIGEVNKSFITESIMNKIMKFLKLNSDLIIYFSTHDNMSDYKFINNLQSI
jgi:hypothetical protein